MLQWIMASFPLPSNQVVCFRNFLCLCEYYFFVSNQKATTVSEKLVSETCDQCVVDVNPPLTTVHVSEVWQPVLQEAVEFESFMLPEENNGAFPSLVTEDSLGIGQLSIDVDTALEAVEGKFLLPTFVYLALYYCFQVTNFNCV